MNKNILFTIFQIIFVILNIIFPTEVLAYISLVNYLLFILYNYRKYFLEFNIGSLLLFLTSLQIFGCFIVETSIIYLPELKKYSFFKGSLPELILIYIIFFYSLFYFLHKVIIKKDILKIRKNKINLKISEKLIIFLIFLYNIYFLYKVVKTPYYELNVDRFNYNEIVFNSLEFFFFKLNFLIVILLSNVYIRTKKVLVKIFIVINIIILILVLFLSGNKFGEYITIMFMIFLVFLPLFYKNIKNLKKIFKKLLIGFLTVIAITYMHKKMYDTNYNFNKFYNYVIQRGAQQGQLWWGTYDRKYKGNIEEVILEIVNGKAKYQYNKKINEQTGIWKIMLLNAPQQVVEAKYESGSRYSCSSKASINYYFGIIGNIIFSIILAKLFSLLYKMFYTNYNNFLLTIFKYFLFIKLNGKLMSFGFMSDFWILLDIKTLILLIVAYILLKYKNLTVKRRKLC